MSALDLATALRTGPSVDAGLRRLVALHAADALLCLEAGLRTDEGTAIAHFYRSLDSESSRLATIATAAAVIRFTEWDAIHVPSCVTPAAVAIPVALDFAVDSDRFVAAVEAGYATGIALAEAIGGVEALQIGVWPTLLAAPAIAAATAAVALGLDDEVLAHAIAMAMAGSSGRGGRPAGSPSARWLSIGEATAKGARAALAAQAGFRGDPALLGANWLESQTNPPLARPDRLSAPTSGAVAAVGLKPFVAARQGTNAVEAFRVLVGDGLPVPAIDEIRVALPPVAVAVVNRPLDPTDRLSTIAHLGLQLGFLAFEPERVFDVGRAGTFGDDAFALASRTVVVADPSLDDEPGSWPARVTVEAGGRVFERTCRRVPGDAGDAAGLTALVASKTAWACSTASAERLNGIRAGLEDARPASSKEGARLMNDMVEAATATSGTARGLRRAG